MNLKQTRRVVELLIDAAAHMGRPNSTVGLAKASTSRRSPMATYKAAIAIASANQWDYIRSARAACSRFATLRAEHPELFSKDESER